MVEVSVCYAPADEEAAHAIQARLERGAEARVWLERCDGETLATGWEAGLSSSAMVLLLSPDSVPPRLDRRDWEGLLRHVDGNAGPPVAAVLVRPCSYPQRLDRAPLWRWEPDRRATLRALERWVVELHPLPEERLCQPARQPFFEGRRAELDVLWETLVDEAGIAVLASPQAGSGKTSLAQEFARQAAPHFRDVLWIGCGDRRPESLAGDLNSQLGSTSPTWEHRLLVVLDDVAGAMPFTVSPEGLASVLITARVEPPGLPPEARIIPLAAAAQPQLHPPEDPGDLRLWQAMAACRPQGFPLDLAAEIAGMTPDEARPRAARLVERRLVDPFDEIGPRFRLSAASLAAVPEPSHRRHGEALQTRFSRWRADPDGCCRLLPEFELGFARALERDWPLAVTMGRQGYDLLRARGRMDEGAALLEALSEAAEKRGDQRVREECVWELSWLDGGLSRHPTLGGEQMEFDFAR